MQIPDVVKKLVFFVEADTDEGSWVGTGFFVFDSLGVRDAKGAPLAMVYAVTARHCVQQIKKDKAPVKAIRLFLNTTNGPARSIETQLDGWVHHDVADVSVYSFGPGAQELRGFDFLYYPVRGQGAPAFVTTADKKNSAEKFEMAEMSPGDDLFMTGLLVYHPGKTRIMPIIRTGTIAALPEDPITMSTGSDHAILVESRSIGGLSGSPVFVHYPPWRYDPEWNPAHLMTPTIPGNAGPNYLIGLVHGVWEAKGNDVDGISSALGEPLNVGITIVTPLFRALDLLDGPKLRGEYEEAKAALGASVAPTPTTAGTAPPPKNPEFENFEELTRQLVHTPKPRKP